MTIELVESLEEQGCEDDHEIAIVAKINTKPPQYKYECQDCGSTATSRKVITRNIHER